MDSFASFESETRSGIAIMLHSPGAAPKTNPSTALGLIIALTLSRERARAQTFVSPHLRRNPAKVSQNDT